MPRAPDHGQHRREITLDRPDLGVYLPPMIWGGQHSYSPDAMLPVFASEYCDPDEYIRDYDEFCALMAAARPARPVSNMKRDRPARRVAACHFFVSACD